MFNDLGEQLQAGIPIQEHVLSSQGLILRMGKMPLSVKWAVGAFGWHGSDMLLPYIITVCLGADLAWILLYAGT
jgi:hypothetical protein